MNKYEKEARQTIQVFKFVFFALCMIGLSGGFLVNGLKGRFLVVSGSTGGFSTADASILSPEVGLTKMPDPVEVVKTMVRQDSLSQAKKLAAAKTSVVSDSSAHLVVRTKLVAKATKSRERMAVNKALDSVITAAKLYPKKRKTTVNKTEESEVLTAISVGIERYPIAEQRYGEIMNRNCSAKGIDPDFGLSILLVESQAYPWVVSRAGARGLMQLMPKTGYALAKARGIKGSWERIVDTLLFDPEIAIMLGTDHIKRSLDFFDGYVNTANAYEAGDVGAFYQHQRAGRSSVDVLYYRKVYGIYQYIKIKKGLALHPTMKPARLPEGLDPSLILVSASASN